MNTVPSIRWGRRLATCALAACLGLTAPAPLLADQAVLHMEIGDPGRKGREVPVVLDGITDTATGELVTPEELARRLAGTGILFIGENHTNQEFHDVQFRTIRALREAGREVLIGLEMFPYTEQASLDHWNAGHYSEEGFVELARWYDNWGYHWNYYRNIFLYAQKNGINMYAVNSPRDVVKAVRAKGFENLTPEEAAHLPPKLAPESDEHRRMYRAFFDKDDALHMNEAALDGLYRAQTMWDATMGWNALQALRQHGGKDAIMVVLIGAGHVTFGLGSERQIAPHYDGRIASLVPVTVVDDAGKPVKQVRASYASFVWGLPEEIDTVYPSIGVSLMGALGKDPGQIIQVSRKSVAERSGLKVGDVLLGLDGRPITSDNTLRRLMAGYRWGDVATARIRRDGRETDVAINFRRSAK
ncbi:MAG: ChaN family lipoprotein [Chromatiales bacterium]|nr:ChaN family lipoprotein [Chromatiales bacterium]